jgi:hypothetical protein
MESTDDESRNLLNEEKKGRNFSQSGGITIL